MPVISIALVQFDSVPEQVGHNLDEIERLVRSAVELRCSLGEVSGCVDRPTHLLENNRQGCTLGEHDACRGVAQDGSHRMSHSVEDLMKPEEVWRFKS